MNIISFTFVLKILKLVFVAFKNLVINLLIINSVNKLLTNI